MFGTSPKSSMGGRTQGGGHTIMQHVPEPVKKRDDGGRSLVELGGDFLHGKPQGVFGGEVTALEWRHLGETVVEDREIPVVGGGLGRESLGQLSHEVLVEYHTVAAPARAESEHLVMGERRGPGDERP